MRYFLTGIAGFAGSHLAEALLSDPDAVVGGSVLPAAPTANIDPLGDRIARYEADLLDRSALVRALADLRPDVIFHLAAVAFVPSDPERILRVNVEGTLTLLAAMRETCPGAKGILISSSEVYGRQPPEAGPIDESRPPAPVSAYARSKLAMEEAAREAAARDGLRLVILRPFNHVGPRQSPDFVVSSLCRQIARIEAGREPPVLLVGNLEPRRDFTDVRDIVRGYALAARLAEPGETFNLASGVSRSVASVLEELLRLSPVRIEVRRDPARVRPVDIPDAVGNASAFRARTNWTPRIPFSRSLADTLEYWRERG